MKLSEIFNLLGIVKKLKLTGVTYVDGAAMPRFYSVEDFAKIYLSNEPTYNYLVALRKKLCDHVDDIVIRQLNQSVGSPVFPVLPKSLINKLTYEAESYKAYLEAIDSLLDTKVE